MLAQALEYHGSCGSVHAHGKGLDQRDQALGWHTNMGPTVLSDWNVGEERHTKDVVSGQQSLPTLTLV